MNRKDSASGSSGGGTFSAQASAKREMDKAREAAKAALMNGDEKAFDSAAMKYAELQRRIDSSLEDEDRELGREGDVDEALLALQAQAEARKRAMEEKADGMRATIESWKAPGEGLAAEWEAAEGKRLWRIMSDLRTELLAEINAEKAGSTMTR
jgi:hypothetical protein